MRDNASSTEAQAEKWERATARDHYIAPADEAAWTAAIPCDECGTEGGGGFVNFGCVTDDCPGCDRCDLPCLSCNPNGRVR